MKAQSHLMDGNDDERYHERNLVDGTDGTWCEGRPGNGVGVRLDVSFHAPDAQGRPGVVRPKLDGLYVQNGFGDAKYFGRNNRVRALEVADASGLFSVELKDSPEIQWVAFPRKVQATPAQGITLTPRSVYAGRDSDTYLTEIAAHPFELAKPDATVLSANSVSLRVEHHILTLKKGGAAEGTYCLWFMQAGECIAMPILRASWKSTGRRVVVKATVAETTCAGLEESSCRTNPVDRTIEIKELSPRRVIGSAGRRGRVYSWK